MEDNPFHPQTQVVRAVRPRRCRPWRVGAAVLLMLLLGGFMSRWLESQQETGQGNGVWREVQTLRLETVIAAAVIEARRGQYDAARENASRFFSALRQELERGEDSVLGASQREACKGLLAREDELIEQLVRQDRVAGDRLTGLYLESRRILRGW